MRPAYLDWFQGRRVFLTGHTGFKGAWLSLWLKALGADVTGYALAPAEKSLFRAARVGRDIETIEGDIRDHARLLDAVDRARPDVVFHLAAQSLVRQSYDDPVETFSTNVVGTATLLDAVRQTVGIQAAVIVTSDKCYENEGGGQAFDEDARMGGSDPYSASKGCAELVMTAYVRSFFSGREGVVASARAGNVIGGGDWSLDRLLPDLMRAARSGTEVVIRRPESIRPWQHVLEPLRGYLMLAHRAATDKQWAGGGWNFGPRSEDAVSVRHVVERIAARWPGMRVSIADDMPGPAEAHILQLECGKARRGLGWRPVLALDDALDLSVDWYRRAALGEDCRTLTLLQIADYEERVATEIEGKAQAMSNVS